LLKDPQLKVSFCFLEEDEDDEILSTSTTGRLWRTSFGRRGGQQFLDICLLKKSYMKALEDIGDEEQDIETVSSLLNTIVDQTVADVEEEQNNDDVGLAARIAKRSLTSTMNVENDAHQKKRLRSNPAATMLSV
jgi:hypothetical protein